MWHFCKDRNSCVFCFVLNLFFYRRRFMKWFFFYRIDLHASYPNIWSIMTFCCIFTILEAFFCQHLWFSAYPDVRLKVSFSKIMFYAITFKFSSNMTKTKMVCLGELYNFCFSHNSWKLNLARVFRRLLEKTVYYKFYLIRCIVKNYITDHVRADNVQYYWNTNVLHRSIGLVGHYYYNSCFRQHHIRYKDRLPS